jgi:hypothetical protein
MEDADSPSPPTQPSGFLVPPTKTPRTALATATPPPPREPSIVRSRGRRSAIGFVAKVFFDAVDDVADAIAAGLGLRDR